MPYADKDKQREYQREWHQRNLQRRRAAWKTGRQQWKDFLRSLKDQKPCTDCGQQYPYYVMDWDHRNPDEKSFTVSKAQIAVSQARVLQEIAKCDLVCANCHRVRTHERGYSAGP